MDYSGMDFNNLINFLHQNCWCLGQSQRTSTSVPWHLLLATQKWFGWQIIQLSFGSKCWSPKGISGTVAGIGTMDRGVSEAWPNAPSSPQHQNSLELVTLEKLQLQTKGCHPYPITADNRCLYLKPKQVALHSWAADRERRCRSNCDQDVMSGKIQFPNWGWVPQWDLSRALIMSDIGTDRACLILL